MWSQMEGKIDGNKNEEQKNEKRGGKKRTNKDGRKERERK